MNKLLTLVPLLLFLTPLTAYAAACTSLTDHIAAHYKLDGNSNDAVHSNNGVDTSVSYSTTNAVINQAGQFGASSQILIPSSTDFTSVTTGASLSGWFYVTAATVSGTILGKATASAPNGTYMRLDVNSAKLNATIGGDNTNTFINGNTTLAINTRYFVAITYDGTTISLWLGSGGSIAKDATDVSFSGATTPSTGSIGIGELGDFSGHQFFTGGAIDEVTWRTCGLTSTQITSLYNSGNGFAYPFAAASPRMLFFHVF